MLSRMMLLVKVQNLARSEITAMHLYKELIPLVENEYIKEKLSRIEKDERKHIRLLNKAINVIEENTVF